MKHVLTILFLLSCTFVNATIINVPANQPTIQAGLDIAVEGDTVLVAIGTYYENITWPDINGIKLIGISEDYCIIDGDSLGSVISYERWETIHDSTTVIKNFTIQNGYSVRGSGIYLRSENQFLLENLIIKNNNLYFPRDFEISNNNRYSIEGGAGIHLDNYSSPIMRNIIICDNYSELNGGGLFIYEDSEPILENVIITDNYSALNGGGISCECGSNPILTNVTISNNSASNNGGGIFIYGGSGTSVLVINCILWGNSSEEIYFDEQWPGNSSISISYSDIQGGEDGIITNGNGIVNWLEGNIDADPLFEDPANGDYHLTEYSPCIDAGDPTSPFDPDGTIADMGAFYFDQLNEINENEIPISEFDLSHYPNPFNPTTTISFDIKENETGTLSIFNIKGQIIESHQFESGKHNYLWNALNQASGIYFYKLQTETTSETRKMLLLK